MHLVILVFVYGPVWLINRNWGKLVGAKQKLEAYFFWNGLIRLFMEISFELILTAMLNVQTADWQTSIHEVRYSTALSIISLALVAIVFPFLSVLYYRNMGILSKKSFKKKYIAGIEGTKYETETPPKSIVAYPTIFAVRRILFSVSVIYMNDSIVAQLSLQILISILYFAYMSGGVSPLESNFARRIEVMNEFTLIIMSYCLFCFTDYVKIVEVRYKIGYAYMAASLANISTHVIFLLRDSCYKLSLIVKRWLYRRNKKNVVPPETAKKEETSST